MALPTMFGNYKLTAEAIDAVVTRTSAGAYNLGYVGNDGVFYVLRSGRSDDDLNGRLKDHVGGLYSAFQFTYCTGAEAAFYAECELYHQYAGAPGNKIHPDRAQGKNWQCPRCLKFNSPLPNLPFVRR